MQNNLGLFLSKRALLSPTREAYVESDGSLRLTYTELNNRCNQLANSFLAAGIATIRALKPIQCSVVLPGRKTSRTKKADCRCAGGPRTPRVAHMVGTPFGVGPGGEFDSS